jgi:hypothetical protein
MKEKIEKMISVLKKFEIEGKSTSVSQRLYNNLHQINKELRYVDTDMFHKLTAKQSLESALINSCKVIDQIKAIKSAKRAANEKAHLEELAKLPERKVLKGYYTDDIYQDWIDENDSRFDIAAYEAYQRFVKKIRKY